VSTTEKLPRVMIVDDVAVIRQVIGGALRARGMDVVAAARNGEEALEFAKERRPDLLLLDIIMPVMPGYEALPKLRALLPEAVIVMLTSTSERNLILECRRNGADGFVIKRDDMAETLAERVLEIWRKRDQRQPAQPRSGDKS
jgi:CheY-like chemotaxis protein